MKITTTKLLLIIFSLFFFSCQDGWDDYYEPSENLLGNAYHYLQSDGNFTIFLKASELTGWDATLDGYGMCTVMAPTDEAFEKYLNGRKLEDIPLEELSVLVAYHLVENSFNTEKLLGFRMVRPEETPTPGTGNCYKFKTFSRDPVSPMYDPINQKIVNVFNRDKYLPIVSSRLFTLKGATDAEANYKYFFPEVDWRGADETLHVQNAAVLEYGIPTNNGYIYIINRVAEPLPNLYQELETQDNFSDFLKVYDKFATVTMDNNLTNTYAQPGDTIYVYEHGVLPRLYTEWTYHNENDSQERYYDKWMKYTYNLFAPTNVAMESFRQKYLSFYSSWDDVSFITLYYILKNLVKERQEILFPEVISSSGSGISGDYGERWYVDPENVVHRKWCANGLLYGIDYVLDPILFRTVSAPLFLNPGFETMTQMMHDITHFPQLIDATEGDKYTIFIVSDENLKDLLDITLDKGAANIFGDETVYREGEAMNEEEKRTLVQSHVVYGAIRDFSKRAFFATQEPYTYLYIEEGELRGESGTVAEILRKWDINEGIVNGVVYEIEDVFRKNTDIDVVGLLRERYSVFYQKLKEAGLINDSDKFSEIDGDRVICFAPKNEVLNALTLPTDKDELAYYLKYYFIPSNSNRLSDYLLPNYGMLEEVGASVQLQTLQKIPTERDGKEIIVKQYNEKAIIISNLENEEVITDGNVPFFATDGLIYGIDSPIESRK